MQPEILQQLQTRLAPDSKLYTGPADTLPPHWQPYLSSNKQERIFALQDELDSVAPYLPRVMAELKKVATDAFLIISAQYGISRIIVREIAGKVYPTYSHLPTKFQTQPSAIAQLIEERAPQALSWLYRVKMDGLTDLYGCAGFKPTTVLTTMADEIDTYGEQPWYQEYANLHNPTAIVELFATGGGGYLLLDLADDHSDEVNPNALLLLIDESTPPQQVLLFQYLDNLMKIGLSE